MFTNEELRISNESYTNKDFLTIYPELLNIIKAISPNWDPSLSNESDPGNVILKAMAFMADKINLNTDVNIDQGYVPSVSQYTPARNLFEMNGYFPRYYLSATTGIKFRYNGSSLESGDSFSFPAMSTVISDEKNKVSYSLMSPATISLARVTTEEIPAIQGVFKTLLVGNNSNIQLSDLDDNNRVYLPETKVAQNGVFVFNTEEFNEGVTSTDDSWERVENLNLVEPAKSKCFKFGFDSTRNLPYVEFTSNISDLIGSGLTIKYVITAGLDGNITAQTLTKLVSPLKITTRNGNEMNFELPEEGSLNTDFDVNNLIIYNVSSSVNGANPETIDEAYNSYKKIVGTFETLTTCRDYANYIYNLIDTKTNNYYVSNVQVADRRSDINFGNNIVTYSSLGKELVSDIDSSVITPFSLCLYPLNPISTIYDKDAYIYSFKPLTTDSLKYIKYELEDLKNLSHTYKAISQDDIYAIKNKYKLTVRLTTTYKVSTAEQKEIKQAVQKALFKNFNAKKVDYGYEIPFDLILNTIKEADARIKNVSLDEPEVTTYLMFGGIGNEELLMKEDMTSGDPIRNHYLQVLAKNILAGRLPLFEYDTDFTYKFGQSSDGITNPRITNVVRASTETEIPVEDGELTNYTLRDDEVIQCIAPSLQSVMTYPAYINFRWDGNNVPANEEHVITGTEVLQINYTDSNKQEINVKYEPNQITKNGKVYKKDFVCIKPNFILKQTADEAYAAGRSAVQKTVNGTDVWFNTLSTNDQIEEREIVARVLTDTELYCYWSTNRADNKLFSANDAVHEDPDDPTSDILYYETLLGDNEYFAYCDAGLTDVVIRGSGTKLRWNATRELTNTDWVCEKQSISTLVDNGISAFSSFNWQVISFAVNTLGIYAMQILTLTVGDSITVTGLSEDSLTNKWQPVSGTVSYQLEGAESPDDLPTVSDGSLGWSIRSRLDLSCGPTLGQKVLGPEPDPSDPTQEDPTSSTHTITFYDDNDVAYSVEGAMGEDVYVALNQFVSVAGGDNIDLKVTVFNNDDETVSEEGLIAYVYKYSDPTYTAVVGGTDVEKTLESKGGYSTIAVSELKYDANNQQVITLPIMATSGEKTLIMFYENKTAGSDYTISIAGNTPAPNNEEVRDFAYSSGAFKPSVELCDDTDAENMMIVEVKDTATALKITITKGASEQGVCNLVIGDMSKILVDGDGKYLNSSFGLSQPEEDELLAVIENLDSTHKFYYNNPVDKGSVIDLDTMDTPDFFWDRNNLYNKFTIGEIDFGDNGSSISIVKSSQL